VVASKKKHTNI